MAAELVLGAVLSVTIDKLVSFLSNQLARSMGIHNELKSLNTALTHIQALLKDASDKEETNGAVKGWLNCLQHLAYDIDDIIDALAYKDKRRELQEEARTISSKVRKLIPTCCTNFQLSTGIHSQLDDIKTRLQALEKDTNSIGLVLKVERHEKINNRKYETCFPEAEGTIGREGEKKALLHKLVGDEACNEECFSIVPIVGIGGVGKTTLARLVYNEEKVKDHFQLRAWVCVSDEFDVFNISEAIYQYVPGEKKKITGLSLLQEELSQNFKEKRFLIVLDDVWSENFGDWKNLVKPFQYGACGSKIIMTSRKEKLLEKLGYNHLEHVGSLSSDDALSLLAQHALGTSNFDSHPTLEPYGVELVKKCGCLPLALRVVGRLLKTKTDEDWDDVLKSNIWKLGNEDESIDQALRLSYHDLSAVLKRLFVYCSLFPKDYLFDQKELVLLWMAEGFLNQSSGITIERQGIKYFDELLSRSFFQQAPNEESLYVMHDLINELATSMAGDFFSRLDIGVKKELMKNVLEKYRHMSLVCEKYITCEKFKEFKGADKLRSFLVLSSEVKSHRTRFYVSNTFLANKILELPLLRVLSLSYLSISELPESIGNLKHLRYLNLSHTNIIHLPEHVCSLHHLQTLIVFGCHKLTELPKSFLKLKSLLHFDIRDTSLLNKMPEGIGALESLRIVVSKIIIEGENIFAVTGLKELMDLQEKLSIEGLEKVKNSEHAKDMDISKKRLEELELRWNDEYDGL